MDLPIKNKSLILNPFNIDPKTPLHKHGAFWWPIIIFVGGGVLASTPFWCLCIPSSNNYGYILENLALPVFVSSISIPFSVAVSRFHLSKQNAFNIEIALNNQKAAQKSLELSIKNQEITQDNQQFVIRKEAFSQYLEHRAFVVDLFKNEINEYAFVRYRLSSEHQFYKFFYPENNFEHCDSKLKPVDVYLEKYYSILCRRLPQMTKDMKERANKGQTVPWYNLLISHSFYVRQIGLEPVGEDIKSITNPSFEFYLSFLGSNVLRIIASAWQQIHNAPIDIFEEAFMANSYTSKIKNLSEVLNMESAFNDLMGLSIKEAPKK